MTIGLPLFARFQSTHPVRGATEVGFKVPYAR